MLSGSTAGLGGRAVGGRAGFTARRLLGRFTLALIVTIICALAIAASPALALTTHAFTTDFGAAGSTPANPYPLSNPADVAVDNSSGASQHDIYVTDPANHRVEKFDSLRRVHPHVRKGCRSRRPAVTSAPPSLGIPARLAPPAPRPANCKRRLSSPSTAPPVLRLATSTSATPADNCVSKFNSSGELVGSWGTGGQLSGLRRNWGDCGRPCWEPLCPQLAEDEGDGKCSSSLKTAAPHTFRDGSPRYGSNGLAVDAEDNLYKVAGSPNVEKFNSTGTDLGQVDEQSNATGLVADPSTNDLYVDQGGTLIEHFTAGCSLNSCAPSDSFGTGHLADAAGVAYDAISGNVYVANAAGGTVAVFAPAVIPSVTVNPVSNFTRTSVTLSAVVEPAGGEKVTACQFEYGTSTAYSLGSVPCLNASNAEVGTPTNPITSRTEVHADLTGLQAETTYHYRIDATDAGGSNIGNDETFTTPPAVTGVSTGSATDIKSTSAMLTGSYTGEGLDTHYYFEYGTTTAYGETTAIEDNGEGTGPQTVAPIAISGLHAETTYHYRIVASNSFGSTPGQDETLTTAPAVAGVSTDPATNLTPVSAMLTGSYIGEGLDTHYYFEWGTTTSYGNKTAVPPGEDAGEGTGPQAVAPIAISGLHPYTTYHYRLVASNSAGTTVGQDETFLTAPPDLPAIESTTSSPGATGTTATLEAQVNPGFGATVSRFQYGTSASYESSTPISESIGSDDSDHLASADVSGLTPGTTYHYRAVAINFTGTTARSRSDLHHAWRAAGQRHQRLKRDPDHGDAGCPDQP